VSGAPFVVVIGPPGVGKSTVAAELAARLGRTLVDTDALVEERAGAAIADIFLDRGEAAFREMESAAVLDGLRQEGIVLALGGGAPMTPAVGEALEGHRVLLLDVGIADAARRIGLNASRPLLGVNPRQSWIKTMRERRPTYERLASWQVDTSGRDVPEVLEAVLAAMGEAR